MSTLFYFLFHSYKPEHLNDINFVPSAEIRDATTSAKAKELISSTLPMIMIAVPFIVPISELVSDPDFSYYGLNDLSLFMRTFNMTILCYTIIT
jgi:hypothetical protein